MSRTSAIYGRLLHCYPGPFRTEYGRQMQLMFEEQLQDARRARVWQEAALWAEAAYDLITIAPREHWHVIRQDLQYTARPTIARPAFALVVILSLALDIGANTAIFTLWHSTQRAALPGVDDPDRLVILTDPGASGLWRGGWTNRIDLHQP